MQEFIQSSIVFEKAGILYEKENSYEFGLPETLIILDKVLHTFSTYQCLQKGVWNFFYFCLDFELFAKTKKTWFLHTRKSQVYP